MGIMFWLFITGLCLFCICWAVLFLTALSDAKKRNIPGYTLKLLLLWEYFVWDYLWLAQRRPIPAPDSEAEKTNGEKDRKTFRTIRIFYFLAIASFLLAALALIFHDLG